MTTVQRAGTVSGVVVTTARFMARTVADTDNVEEASIATS
jgi:hypothetical protein